MKPTLSVARRAREGLEHLSKMTVGRTGYRAVCRWCGGLAEHTMLCTEAGAFAFPFAFLCHNCPTMTLLPRPHVAYPLGLPDYLDQIPHGPPAPEQYR